MKTGSITFEGEGRFRSNPIKVTDWKVFYLSQNSHVYDKNVMWSNLVITRSWV